MLLEVKILFDNIKNFRHLLSEGIADNSIRTIQASVMLDNGTTDASLQNGEITTTTWTELTN